MPANNPSLHGNVPDKADFALLLIDVINDLEFEEGEQLLRYAMPMAERIAALKERAVRARVPAIYLKGCAAIPWYENGDSHRDGG